MYTAQAPPRPVHRQFPGGPPLAGLAITSTVLFLTGLIASTAMAGKAFPSPFDSAASILAYFHGHQDAITVLAIRPARNNAVEVTARPASGGPPGNWRWTGRDGAWVVYIMPP